MMNRKDYHIMIAVTQVFHHFNITISVMFTSVHKIELLFLVGCTTCWDKKQSLTQSKKQYNHRVAVA